jgi:hexosaminidase
MRLLSILATAVIAAAACCNPNQKELTVVPYPNSVDINCGVFKANGADFNYDAAIDARSTALISSFAEQFSLVSGTQNKLVEATEGNGFLFLLDESLPAEAYTLKISRGKAVVKASGLNGFNYAIQTIKQMLPVEIYGKTEAPGKEWTLLCCEIEDEPRFGYRGMHLDESRHFFGMDAVKRYLDIMEIHKLNTLHWHLTDDQGWRVEIKKYPKLTEVGSIRKKTIIGHIFRSKDYDTTPYGNGMWYTQDQIREIIEYAAAKGITIIPEIDLPGHMLAALAAYPELGCTGGPYDVWGDWGISDDVLCVGKEQTMQFLENVLSEICDLFPSEYIHIGGDECPKVRWEKCPRCQAKIRELGLKANEEYQPEHFLQGYVMSRMEKFINSKGKRIIGWDEILEGEVAPNATIMSWRGVAGGLQAVHLGHDAIMTPNTFYYLDYYQSLDKEKEPLAIGGYLPIEKCYSYEPFVEGMTEQEKAHVLGVQANLWTEYIATESHLQYMLLPRMAALSEVQWCQPENKSWERFYNSADAFCSIYDAMGYNYGKHIFEVKAEVKVNKEKGCVEVGLQAQGNTPIRYTLDGSEPEAASSLYTGPIEIRESCTLKAKSDKNDKVYEKTFTAHKAMGRPVVVLTETHPSYKFNCPDLLTDGITGKGPYNSGDYAGWYNKPFEAVIDMGGQTFSKVTLSTFVYKYDYIFNPLDLTIYTSENGEDFTELAHTEFPVEGKVDDGNGCQKFNITIPETSAEYLKVTANTIKALPEWHSGKGRPGFVFIDEVMVD